MSSCTSVCAVLFFLLVINITLTAVLVLFPCLNQVSNEAFLIEDGRSDVDYHMNSVYSEGRSKPCVCVCVLRVSGEGYLSWASRD